MTILDIKSKINILKSPCVIDTDDSIHEQVSDIRDRECLTDFNLLLDSTVKRHVRIKPSLIVLALT
jgi:hypothetical protein